MGSVAVLDEKGVVVPAVAASSTTVTGVLTDIGGNVWLAAHITARFVPPSNGPGPYYWGSNPMTQFVYEAGTDGTTGTFSMSLPDNLTISPAGTMWQFTISPNATMPAVIFTMMVVGTSMDISTIFTSQSYQLQNTLVQPYVLPRAYSDAEVAAPPAAGALYYNSPAHSVMLFVGSGGWYPLKGPGISPANPGDLAANVKGASGSPTGFPDGPVPLAGLSTTVYNVGILQFAYSGANATTITEFFYRIYLLPNIGYQPTWYKITGVADR